MLIYTKRVNTRKVSKIENGIRKETILHFESGLHVSLLYLDEGFFGPWGLVSGCDCEFIVSGMTGKLGLKLELFTLSIEP